MLAVLLSLALVLVLAYVVHEHPNFLPWRWGAAVRQTRRDVATYTNHGHGELTSITPTAKSDITVSSGASAYIHRPKYPYSQAAGLNATPGGRRSAGGGGFARSGPEIIRIRAEEAARKKAVTVRSGAADSGANKKEANGAAGAGGETSNDQYMVGESADSYVSIKL